jgi:conjugal transfer mating pair stabilization protein TraG
MTTIVKLKTGVRLDRIHAATVVGLQILVQIFSSMGIPELVITSAQDSTEHKEGSLHYVGKALDIRSKALEPAQKRSILVAFNAAAGENFDFILEAEGLSREHFHMEVDPDD